MPQLFTLVEDVDSLRGYHRAEANAAADRRRAPGDGGSQPDEACPYEKSIEGSTLPGR